MDDIGPSHMSDTVGFPDCDGCFVPQLPMEPWLMAMFYEVTKNIKPDVDGHE